MYVPPLTVCPPTGTDAPHQYWEVETNDSETLAPSVMTVLFTAIEQVVDVIPVRFPTTFSNEGSVARHTKKGEL